MTSAVPMSFPPATVPAPPKRVVMFAVKGEIVRVENTAGAIDPLIVMTRCGYDAGIYCVSHQRALANYGQAEMHFDDAPGEHRLIRWCRRHGVPESADDRDVAWAKTLRQLEMGL